LFLKEDNNSINERLPRTVENGIDKPFCVLRTLFIGCLIESPGIMIIHGGVLAMRGCFLAKLLSQRTPLFQISTWLPAKSE
tara:strand:- start:96 stop:338 length:243 start_codon:yes stop_codon:yes gene_type:complete